LLWQGERAQALAHLHSLRPTTGEVPLPLQDAIQYVQTQQDWIGNYEQWQADGYPLGRGLGERDVAVLINMRMKKRGMRWKRANATAVVALRVQRINADWEAATLHPSVGGTPFRVLLDVWFLVFYKENSSFSPYMLLFFQTPLTKGRQGSSLLDTHCRGKTLFSTRLDR
jgi:hypothetical protein